MTTEHELSFSHELIKGRIAEAIVTELFTLSGYAVHPFGVEHIAPSIVRIGAKGRVANMLRKSPDLLVQDESGSLFLIEVKYRVNGAAGFKTDDYLAETCFPDCFVILLDGKRLICATSEELRNKKPFVPLVERREFTFEKGLITRALGWTSEFLAKK